MFTLHFIPPDTKGTFQGIYILASKAFSLTHLFVSGFWQPMPHFGFSVMSNSATSRTATYQASLRFSHRVCSNSCPLSQWCHPAISSSIIPFSSCLQSFPASRSFRIRWPKYWSLSFSISPSNEYSGLISFRIDWFGLLAVQGTLKYLLHHHSLKASVLWHSAFFMVQLSHPYMSTLLIKVTFVI